MSAHRPLVLLVASCLIALPCLADVVPVVSLTHSTATMPDGVPGVVTVMIVPDGSGPGFAEARDLQGNIVDATIELFICDQLTMPIANYPWEDIWLEPADNMYGLAACRPYSGGVYHMFAPDDHTDHNGLAYWTVPPHGGGYADSPMFVMIQGDRLLSNEGLALRFNSPDINVDGIVNLVDVAHFAEDFYGEYHFRSDLAHDGVVNLSDVADLARHMGAGCP